MLIFFIGLNFRLEPESANTRGSKDKSWTGATQRHCTSTAETRNPCEVREGFRWAPRACGRGGVVVVTGDGQERSNHAAAQSTEARTHGARNPQAGCVVTPGRAPAETDLECRSELTPARLYIISSQILAVEMHRKRKSELEKLEMENPGVHWLSNTAQDTDLNNFFTRSSELSPAYSEIDLLDMSQDLEVPESSPKVMLSRP